MPTETMTGYQQRQYLIYQVQRKAREITELTGHRPIRFVPKPKEDDFERMRDRLPLKELEVLYHD